VLQVTKNGKYALSGCFSNLPKLTTKIRLNRYEKFIVRLTDGERRELESIVKKLKGTSQKVNRALALLHADADGPDWTNEQIASRTGLTLRAISNIRKQLVTEGFEVTIDRKKRRLPHVPKNSIDCKKQNSLQHVVVLHRRALGNGRFDCSPIKRSFWKSPIRSAMKRFDKR
jgi:hypothetical protein